MPTYFQFDGLTLNEWEKKWARIPLPVKCSRNENNRNYQSNRERVHIQLQSSRVILSDFK